MRISSITPYTYKNTQFKRNIAMSNLQFKGQDDKSLQDKEITRLDSKVVIGRAPGNCSYGDNHSYIVDEAFLTKDLLFLKEKYNVDTVVDLRATNIEGDNYKKEGAAAKSLGMNYLNLEMDGAIAPTYEQLDKFFNAANNSKGSVYIHCHAGQDRTGMLSACYLAKTHKLDQETAFRRVFDERNIVRLKYMYGHPDQYNRLSKTLWELKQS